jgi:hypothetical protein
MLVTVFIVSASVLFGWFDQYNMYNFAIPYWLRILAVILVTASAGLQCYVWRLDENKQKADNQS